MFVVKSELDKKTIKLMREAIRLWRDYIDELCDEQRLLVEAKCNNQIDGEEFEEEFKWREKEISCAIINKMQIEKIVN